MDLSFLKNVCDKLFPERAVLSFFQLNMRMNINKC